MLEQRAADVVEQLRHLGADRDLVLLDYDLNGDVSDLSSPLSHAALVRLHLIGQWPAEA
jgi:hypothetical protein